MAVLPGAAAGPAQADLFDTSPAPESDLLGAGPAPEPDLLVLTQDPAATDPPANPGPRLVRTQVQLVLRIQ